MQLSRIALLAPFILLGLIFANNPNVRAESKPMFGSRTSAPSAPRPIPSVFNAIVPEYRQTVHAVMKDATLSARANEEPFLAHPNIFDWLTEHPDRASLAWQRMSVPCVEITQLADGRFHWKENGSELTWRLVGRFEHGMIWYATGQVKPGALLPTVPVKAVAVLGTPRHVNEQAGTTELSPAVNVFVQTDSRAASAALRLLGPAAPRLAEQGAQQMLLFFTGPARYIYKHPDEAQTLLAPGK